MKKHTLLLACAMRILLNLIALLGCARDDETGSGWFLIRFQIAAIHLLPSVCPSSTSSQRGGMPEGLRRAFFSYRRRV